MVKNAHIDWVRMGTALAVALLLGLFWWGAVSMLARAADMPEVEMMLVPGSGKTIPMPPKWMRDKIEARMASGDVPGYVERGASQMRKSCKVALELYGCNVNFHGMKVTYVRTGLSAELRHMVLVHEYAHDLYNWVH